MVDYGVLWPTIFYGLLYMMMFQRYVKLPEGICPGLQKFTVVHPADQSQSSSPNMSENSPCSWHTLGRRPRTFVAFLLIGVGWGGVG